MIAFHRLASLVPLALLGACATSGDYPSLAPRDAERATGTFAPDAAVSEAPPPPAASADLVERLAGLQREAEARHTEFIRATAEAERLAGAAGAAASDSWASAQVALADLDSLRSRVAVALAELDALWVDAAVEDGPLSAIGPVRDRVEAIVAAEDTVLARLRRRIG